MLERLEDEKSQPQRLVHSLSVGRFKRKLVRSGGKFHKHAVNAKCGTWGQETVDGIVLCQEGSNLSGSHASQTFSESQVCALSMAG